MSQVAGAVWYPYQAGPRHKILEWSRQTYQVLVEQSTERLGVRMVPFEEVFEQRPDPAWWAPAVPKVSIRGRDHPDYHYARYFDAPTIDTDRYLRALTEQFTSKGGVIDLGISVDGLSDLQDACDLAVNCSGLASRVLTGDQNVYPIKGQIVRMTNPGISRTIADDEGPLSIAYIIPHENEVVLGGSAETGNWSREVDDRVTKDILARCTLLDSRISEASFISAHAGLRPCRNEVRLELEQLSPNWAVIHNYGHGGAGYTIGWGCANEVARLAERWFADARPVGK